MADEMMNNGIFGGDGLIILILFFLMFSGGFANKPASATPDDVYNATNQQTTANKLNEIQNAITSSAYENAALINTNSSNIVSAINNGFTSVGAQITALGTQMQQCCCDLKTQMLQDKYDACRAELLQAQGIIANSVQTNNITSTIINALKPTAAAGTATA